MSDSSDKTVETLVTCFFTLILWPLALWIDVWGLCKLWLWYIVPHFGVAPLPLKTSLGIGLIIGAAWYRYDSRKTEERPKNDYICQLISSICTTLFAVLLGWLAKGL